MRTIRHFKMARLAPVLLAATLSGSTALAQQSANDINRIAPQRDLTKSIPSSGPTSAAPSQPAPAPPIARPKHRPRTVIHCSPASDAMRSCPVVVLGTDDAPPPPPVADAAPPGPVITPVVTPVRPIIITHEMVETLQSKLQEAGAYSGPISGLFDMPTRNALMAWQRANGKKPTGSLNATTLEDFGISR